MEKNTDIMIQVIKSGKRGSGRLLRENRSRLIEALARNYDSELAKRLEGKRTRHIEL